MTVSQWAAAHRILDNTSSESGPWSNERTPYLVGIMDAFTNQKIVRITILSGTQVGKTEAILNMLGYVVDQDPSPTMLVMPNEESADDFGYRKLQPAIQASPRWRASLREGRSDKTMRALGFDRMILRIGPATSPSALARHSIRYLFMDEVDKYPLFSGREADPISLAIERTNNWPDRKIVMTSTPITASGYIFSAYKQSDQRQFHVPCPRCSTYQVLVFGDGTGTGIRVPDGMRDPVAIEQGDLARYECIDCKAQLVESEKPRMLRRGVWVPDGAEIRPDGSVRGAPASDHAGFHLSALYSPWRRWSQVAAEFFRSKEKIAGLQNFNNSWLGQPWVETSVATKASAVDALVEDYPENTVPDEGQVLTCGIDVHGDAKDFYYVVRAWGSSERSWLVKAGKLQTWDQVAGLIERTTFRRGRDSLNITLTCIDSGYRTDEVYEFARDLGDHVRPTKGVAHIREGSMFQSRPIERTVDGKPFGVILWRLDTTMLKDKLTRMMAAGRDQPGRFAIHAEPSPSYLRALVSEHKEVVRNRQTGIATEEWKPKHDGGPTHWWDTEVYALAAAQMLQLYTLGGDVVSAAPAAAAVEEPRGRARESSFLGGGQRGGFIGARRGGWLRS